MKIANLIGMQIVPYTGIVPFPPYDLFLAYTTPFPFVVNLDLRHIKLRVYMPNYAEAYKFFITLHRE